MRRIVFAFLAVCLFAVIGHSQIPQRLHFTNLNPPTACIPGHEYTNPGLNPARSWVGTSTGACTRIDAGAAGTVTTVSVVSANGQSGSVATSTTTPAITLNNPTALNATTSIQSPFFVSAAADPADAGAIRLGNNEVIGWEKATPGTDWTLGVNASDVLITNAPFSSAGLIQTTGADGSQFEIKGAGITDFKMSVGASGYYVYDVTNNKTPFVISPNTSNSVTIGTSTVAIVAPTTATSLALGGATIGSDALGVTGTTTHNASVTLNGAPLIISGNISAATWTTSGVRIKGTPGTLTDTTAATGTTATAYTDVLGGNTIAATNVNVVFTNYFTQYNKDPIAGTNVTLTNKWALGADSVKFGTSNQLTVSNAGAVGINAAQTNTVSSATAFEIGPNGGTNPVLRVITNVASQADGISISGGAAGAGTTIQALTSGTNAGIALKGAGTGGVTLNVGQTTSATTDLLINPTTKASGNLVDAQVNSVSQFKVTSTGIVTASTQAANTVAIGNSAGGIGLRSNVVDLIGGGVAALTVAGSGIQVQINTQLAFGRGSTATVSGDGFITSIGAANLQLGAAAAASPVAQTLSTQGSRSGTDSNVAGANLTLTSGIGTGNSTGSSLILSTPVAVASGTGAQTQTATLTLQGGNTTINGRVGVGVAPSSTIYLYTSANQTGNVIAEFDNTNATDGFGVYVSTAANDATRYTLKAHGGGGDDLVVMSNGTLFGSTRITTATGTPGSICYNTSTFEIVKNNALTCTVSSRDYKLGITDLTELSAFDKLRPVEFAYRDHVDRPRWGFIAEEAAEADRRFADGYDVNGIPRSLDQNGILAATVKELQQLKARVKELEAKVQQ